MRVDSPDHPQPFSLEDLAQRLERLPDGHPSSPRNGDGTPRPPVLRLKDLELPLPEDDEPLVAEPESDSQAAQPADRVRPYTDAEWAEHVSEVRTWLAEAQGQGLATDQRFTNDPDRLRWTRERRQLHREITESLYQQADDIPCEGKAVVCGGLGGAGKSTVLSNRLGNETTYFTINPDDVKAELARRGMIPAVNGLSPMEASDLVHEESSRIAKQLARRALGDRRNVIWDITMSSRRSTEQRIDQLRSAGYTRVDGIFVDIPVDTSMRRADARHRSGENQCRAGNGLGGRYVPPEVIRDQADPAWGSQNRKTFEELKLRFDSWEHYDNSLDGRHAILVDAGYTYRRDRVEEQQR